MYDIVSIFKKYNLLLLLDRSLKGGDFMRLSSFKGITIQAISTYEYSRFTSSCMIYKNLTLFKNCIQYLSMWVWWKYAHKHCKEVHKIKCMFRLLIGQNCLRSSVSCFDKTSPLCINCTDRHIESVEHVLFQCTYFEHIRKPLRAKILRCCSVTLLYVLKSLT